MNRDNLSDRFNHNWANACAYPNTILRSPRPHEVHTRRTYCDALSEKQDNLFDAEDQKLEIWETRINNSFVGSTFTTVDGMRSHLEKANKDPHIRHTFLESADSRSPINCSPNMFKTLLTYHQVEPSFLDAVHTFGEQDDPKDLCLMSFRSSDTLTTPGDKLVRIPELGRSGRELHVSYLLRSVERKSNKGWPWQIRQAAVYHSFDTETGVSFWLTIKGNPEFNRRIKESSSFLELPAKSSDKDTALYFKASLATHLVHLSWCDENWRQFINDVEDGIRKILEHARRAPIDDNLKDSPTTELVTYPKLLRERSRAGTMRSHAQSRTSTGPVEPQLHRQSTWETVSSVKKALTGLFNGPKRQKLVDEEIALGEPAPLQVGNDDDNSGESLIDTQEVLNEFRFGDVQTLYTFSDRIRRALLTLKLNISVLHELHDYYDRLLTSDIEAFKGIKDACKDSLVDFLREVKSISHSLETRRSQLECLATLLTEGNTLYDGILQYRQLDISQRFQETAQESADQMRIIADKTRLETASMHVITVVTLVFLPATFVSTFFQSGVFLWNNNPPQGMTETYRYRPDSFRLFVWVTLPFMVIILGIWLFVFLWMKRKTARSTKLQDSLVSIVGKETK